MDCACVREPRIGVQSGPGAGNVERGVFSAAGSALLLLVNNRRLSSGVNLARDAVCGGDAKKSSGLNGAAAGVDGPGEGENERRAGG